MEKNDNVYLRHILQSIKLIEEYTSNYTLESFEKSTLVQDAVVRNLEIIGEATKNLSKEFRLRNLHINWKQMAAMRDKLVHDYMGVNVDIVWVTIQEDIPYLKEEIQKILEVNT